MTERIIAFIALGSNLGDREKYLADARHAIAALPLTRLLRETAIEETESIGPIEQPGFLNQMISVETELAPGDLLARLLEIENRAGRIRGEKWGPRTLDLDIVAIEGKKIETDSLVVPHPELPNREFWLRELDFLRQSP